MALRNNLLTGKNDTFVIISNNQSNCVQHKQKGNYISDLIINNSNIFDIWLLISNIQIIFLYLQLLPTKWLFPYALHPCEHIYRSLVHSIEKYIIWDPGANVSFTLFKFTFVSFILKNTLIFTEGNLSHYGWKLLEP